MNSELNEALLKAKLRTTKPRTQIFDTLKSLNRPMSIMDIVNACPGIDKVSVYRTIELFVELRIVSTIPHGWKHVYELAAPFIPHHHHLICEKCGNLTEIHSDRLESIITSLTDEHGFKTSGHHFEITGLCRECAP
jgi:Fur family transcriptional regulator, ferric uptake regulator